MIKRYFDPEHPDATIRRSILGFLFVFGGSAAVLLAVVVLGARP